MLRKNKYLSYIDWRFCCVILGLMGFSLWILSSIDPSRNEELFLTPKTIIQIQRFVAGWIIFFIAVMIDYNKLREWVWILYPCMLGSLLLLFVTPSIQGVHRWFKIPLIHISIQPSEYAKLISVITLSWFLERNKHRLQQPSVAVCAGLIFLVPAFLIYQQPDLGTALVLLPVGLGILYLSDLNRTIMKFSLSVATVALCAVLILFSGVVNPEKVKPIALKVLKEYQYQRLDPNNHHQKSAQIAIGLGGLKGTGWRQGEFSRKGWLPFAHTDSIFAACAEEGGLLVLVLLLSLFAQLIFFSFQVISVAQDDFGRFLAAGIATYLTVHILMNIAMMLGLMPITGIPLVLISYGGSSLFVTMGALGILQSIYVRRFIF